MGRRLFNQWLVQPLRKVTEIKYRMNLIYFYSCNLSISNIISHFLQKLPDLDKLLIKFYNIKSKNSFSVSLFDCYKLYVIVDDLENMNLQFDQINQNKQYSIALSETEKKESIKGITYLHNLFSQILRNFGDYKEFIESSIDLNRIERERKYKLHPSIQLLFSNL